MSEPSRVTYHRGDSEEMLQASQRARDSFREFWYQVALDFNRIIPALGLAVVKAPFSDHFEDTDSPIEHMFVEQVNFDGLQITGVLVNQPNALQSISAGDDVRLPLEQLGDWLCVMDAKVYGAFTVQLIRSYMNDGERADYDAAWGLPFPPPEEVLIPEHDRTMENNLAKMLVEQIAEDPTFLSQTLEAGRTLLHQEALYGRTATVQVLLNHGLSPTARCDRGWTPKDYAHSLGWTEVIRLLDTATPTANYPAAFHTPRLTPHSALLSPHSPYGRRRLSRSSALLPRRKLARGVSFECGGRASRSTRRLSPDSCDV